MKMRFRGFSVSANVSLLFTELPYLDRFAAAHAAGFDTVETWWPFATPSPDAAEVDALMMAIETSGARLTGLNLWAGDMAAGERGVASLPDRESELRDNIPVVFDIARRSGCRAFNLLYGRTDPGRLVEGHAHATKMIRYTADAMRDLGGVILIEPLAAGANGTYPLHTVEDALDVIARAGDPGNVALLFDLFHLGSNDVDLIAATVTAGDRIGHVQFADSPGRGEPGTGSLPINATLDALRSIGYTRGVAAEYKPTRATLETLDWADE